MEEDSVTPKAVATVKRTIIDLKNIIHDTVLPKYNFELIAANEY